MKLARLTIQNFRGISTARLLFPDHAVLIGDNNTGKSTVLEAIDLVLGPERSSRRGAVDEHDFYLGRYRAIDEETPPLDEEAHEPAEDADRTLESSAAGIEAQDEASGNTNDDADVDTAAPEIRIEATICELSDEQRARFRDYVEWWDKESAAFYTTQPAEGVDSASIVEALRILFVGKYIDEEDDFSGVTYFARSCEESDNPQPFSRRDKQFCGFLYLRSLRTGTRALSLERGSLLDIILRLKEIRPQMWETTIRSLAEFDVASAPESGVSGVLKSINASLSKYVPREWGIQPHLRVSALTREHLRRVITAFVATGKGNHSAPFYRQGTGTINMLVLAMLSQIAEDKQNVIFAMEEPETAIPPYAQKRIVHEIRQMSAQSLFTTHSPYVIEEYDPTETVVLSRSDDGELTQSLIELPESVKLKRYRQEFRSRFCEGLLSRRVLVVEGATEATAFPVVARRLAELAPERFTSLEALGVCTLDAGAESQIAALAAVYRGLGKTVYAACDKQSAKNAAAIRDQVDDLFMHDESGLEALVLKNTSNAALERFAELVTWPPHLQKEFPTPRDDAAAALSAYFRWTKGNWGVADFLAQCDEVEIPQFLRDACQTLREQAEAQPTQTTPAENTAAGDAALTGADEDDLQDGTAGGD